jgi:hypothetical protein
MRPPDERKQMSKQFAYFHWELPNRETGERFAQIVVMRNSRVEKVGFEVVYDDATHLKFEVLVAWQLAGEYKRKTHHLPQTVHLSQPGTHALFPGWITPRWSRLKTPSGNTRYHLMGDDLAYVQLEGDEVQEMWDRLNAAPNYDSRVPIMLDYAYEMSRGMVGQRLSGKPMAPAHSDA